MKKLLTTTSLISLTIANCSYSYDNQYKNWGLANTRSSTHIDAPDAWRITRGNRNVVVAVIDTGIDSNHPDLANHLWHDPETNNFGWNFVTDQPNPSDNHGHGSHIAGIIAGSIDPRNGMAGIAPNVQIMSVKYYADGNPGSVNLKNSIKALNYAIDHGANIINYSGGGPEFNEDEYLAIRRAEEKGIVVVAAAGNEHHDTDIVENHYYPASYRISNTIIVASTDINGIVLTSSNWGQKSVDLAAPGENIYSTLPGGRFGYMTGTSQATAFVTGTVALLLSCHYDLTPQAVKRIVMESSSKLAHLENKVNNSGIANAYAALQQLIKERGRCTK